MEPFSETDIVAQICFVTHDVDKSAQWFADLMGKELPPLAKAADREVAKATLNGQPAHVTAKIRMFKFKNIDVEFLEPGPEASSWRDWLDRHGPSCHHIAFRTRNLTKKDAYLTENGHPLLQRGETDGAMGRYAYYDTEASMGALIELLERNSEMDPQP